MVPTEGVGLAVMVVLKPDEGISTGSYRVYERLSSHKQEYRARDISRAARVGSTADAKTARLYRSEWTWTIFTLEVGVFLQVC
jgi:hypothetical protein